MFLKFVMAMALFFVTVLNAQAATPQDVHKVVQRLLSNNVHGFLIHQKDSSGVKVVFEHRGIRYTMWVSVKDKAISSIYANPQKGGNDVLNFADKNGDGIVDYGMKVGSEVKPTEKMTFHSGTDGISPPAGSAFMDYWQKEYDRTISDTINFLQQNP